MDQVTAARLYVAAFPRPVTGILSSQAVLDADLCCGWLLQSMDQMTAARLYVAAFPWPVDTLDICSKIMQQGGAARARAASSSYNFRQLLQQSTSLSPFRAIAYSPTPST